MKAGLKRLIKSMDKGKVDMDQFLEDTRVVAAESPDIADVFASMIGAEFKAIKQKRVRGKPLCF